MRVSINHDTAWLGRPILAGVVEGLVVSAGRLAARRHDPGRTRLIDDADHVGVGLG